MIPGGVKYVKINSSNINGYFYYSLGKKLYIQFANGREYEYSDVTQEEVDQLIKADSFGKKLREIIIPHKKFKEID